VLVAPLVLSLRALQELQYDTTMLRDREYAATLLIGRMRSVHDDLLQGTTYIALYPGDSSQAQYVEQIQRLNLQTDTLASLTQYAAVGQIRSAIGRLRESAPRAFGFARANRPFRRDSVIDLVSRRTSSPSTARSTTHRRRWNNGPRRRSMTSPFVPRKPAFSHSARWG
jgi:hypothetical protein